MNAILISRTGGDAMWRYVKLRSCALFWIERITYYILDANSNSATGQKIQFHRFGTDSCCNFYGEMISLIDENNRYTSPINVVCSLNDVKAVIPPHYGSYILTIASYTQTVRADITIINEGVSILFIIYLFCYHLCM